jgi:hypothetical protein
MRELFMLAMHVLVTSLNLLRAGDLRAACETSSPKTRARVSRSE